LFGSSHEDLLEVDTVLLHPVPYGHTIHAKDPGRLGLVSSALPQCIDEGLLFRTGTLPGVSKIFVNEIIVANTGHSPRRHARESGHPEDMGLSSGAWIPAPCLRRDKLRGNGKIRLSGHRSVTCPNIIDV